MFRHLFWFEERRKYEEMIEKLQEYKKMLKFSEDQIEKKLSSSLVKSAIETRELTKNRIDNMKDELDDLSLKLYPKYDKTFEKTIVNRKQRVIDREKAYRGVSDLQESVVGHSLRYGDVVVYNDRSFMLLYGETMLENDMRPFQFGNIILCVFYNCDMTLNPLFWASSGNMFVRKAYSEYKNFRDIGLIKYSEELMKHNGFLYDRVYSVVVDGHKCICYIRGKIGRYNGYYIPILIEELEGRAQLFLMTEDDISKRLDIIDSDSDSD